MIDPLSPTPLYIQVADDIQAKIEAGTLQPARPIPSEKTLQQEHGVSRGTARSAVKELQKRNLVHTIQGRGTFVK
jgi:DNA-binding GntR family transcriptional regulator